MGDQTITTCTGIFYDTGGDSGNYNDDEDFTMTFIPGAAGSKIIVEFESFDVEYQASCTYDWLKVYDGESTSASLIGTYCGTDSPGMIQATNDEGAITFEFHSDYSQTEAGWKALISCTSPPLLPVANFEADTTHIVMGETIQFTDLTLNNPSTWAWMFPGGTPASSSLQNPEIKYEESGIFDVTLVVQNEFGSDSKTFDAYITVDSTIGISELLENGLSVFPNPLTSDILNIQSESIVEKIELYDYFGKMVLQKSLNATSAGINMQALNKGIYILKVYTTVGFSVLKVSVVK